METAHSHTRRISIDETSCGAFCQHPACWQSNQRKEKGFPLRLDEPITEKSEPETDTSLPEVTVYNLIEDYGEDERDRFPAKHSGRPSEERHEPFPALTFPPNFKGEVSLSPLLTPASIIRPEKRKSAPRVKVLEVQELFDVEDLESRWDETFITKQCYVWVPNPNRQYQHEKEDLKAISGLNRSEGGTILPKDVTEQLVPEIIEREREETRLPFTTLPVLKSKKRLAARCRSPNYGRGRHSMKSSGYPRRVPFDTDGINDLLSLPSDVLMQVLDQLNDSDFMSKDRINDVIQDFQPLLVRDVTGISLGTAEALQQKKIPLLKDKKRNIRESHLMETRPVFQLDDGFVLEQISCVNTPVELESNVDESTECLSIQGFSKYKKPLPAIGRLKGHSNKTSYNRSKIASISLGLPELPTGIKHTRPFTYKKTDTMDLSIGPMPTPPTSVRSSSSGGSDHGTTLQVNLTSQTDNTSSKKHEIDVRFPEMPVSPDVDYVPKVPVSTPDTNKEKTGSSSKQDLNTRCHTVSPNQRVLVPVNSPTNSETGLRTIPEMSPRDPPHSTSQIKDLKQALHLKDTSNMMEDELNKLNDGRYSESPTKTFRTEDQNIEISNYSSPDPWPQVTEAVIKSPEESTDMTTSENQISKSQTAFSRSEIHSREVEQQQIVRKMLDERSKGNSPAPPPPSPEGKELDRIPSSKPVSRESAAFMEPLLESDENIDDTQSRGEDVEAPIDTEVQVTMVSEVVPNPQSLVKEKSFHNFVNVDIPAETVLESNVGDKDRPKIERSVQSFVSVDIPASSEQRTTDSIDKETLENKEQPEIQSEHHEHNLKTEIDTSPSDTPELDNF